MANAGCINAYDCNGCLIQTLQNLDSACIGVGVQYTAPNPLDDKRLDYIKYTDKCGCVQCLSAENEILIYATNGVIKNLTLTNDDVNEAIKIKWNDIFGSNRAKTIVRYKTGSYPTSITDGTLAVEETTKNQYSSTPFSLSGVLDETTYYISAFAVDSNGTMINVQSNSITTDFIFGGYQRVEWIGSSGTQWIDTGIIPTSNTKSQMKVSFIEYTGDVVYGYSQGDDDNDYRLFNAYTRLGDHSLFELGRTTFDFSNQRITGNVGYFQLNTIYELELGNYYLKNITTGTNLVSGSAISYFTGSRTITLNNYNNTYFSKNKWYYVKIYNNGTLIRDFYPVYRKSDNVIGLLDIVNKVFYTNQGSGSFTKGPNI